MAKPHVGATRSSLIYGAYARIAAIVALATCGILALYYLTLVVFQGVNFDEHVHMHYGWLISQGKMPVRDFLCHYPNFFYFIMGYISHLLPQNHLFLLCGRLLMVPLFACIAATVAVFSKRISGSVFPGLLVLLVAPAVTQVLSAFVEFRPDLLAYLLGIASCAALLNNKPTRTRYLLAGAAVTLSLLIMPKHVFILGGALGGWIVCDAITTRWNTVKSIGWMVLGCVVAVVIAAVITRGYVKYLLLNIQFAHGAFQTVPPFGLWKAFCDLSLAPSGAVPALIALAGVIGIFFALRDTPRHLVAPVLGGVAGLVVYIIYCRIGYPQYLVPIYITLAFAAPFCVRVLGPRLMPGAIAIAGILCVVAVSSNVRMCLENTNMFKQIELQRVLLSLVPEGEYVVSCPFTHPWFRPDPGYVYYDHPSYRTMLPQTSQHFFSEAYFLERLKSTRPAYFCFFTMDNQPPEYTQACGKYLQENSADYVQLGLFYDGHGALRDKRLPIILRKDLLKDNRP